MRLPKKRSIRSRFQVDKLKRVSTDLQIMRGLCEIPEEELHIERRKRPTEEGCKIDHVIKAIKITPDGPREEEVRPKEEESTPFTAEELALIEEVQKGRPL